MYYVDGGVPFFLLVVMRVLKARAALLSDFEVLQLLRDSEAEQRNEARSRKEQHVSDTDVAPNFRTMQFEAITSLSQPFRACSLQKAENIRAFLDDLRTRGYVIPDERILADEPGLTKAERLQLVNHAPSSVVELHTLVEELGQRMNDDQINEIIQCVTAHLPIPDSSNADVSAMPMEHTPHMTQDTSMTQAVDIPDADMDEEDAFPEEHFEHEEPGANVDQDAGGGYDADD